MKSGRNSQVSSGDVTDGQTNTTAGLAWTVLSLTRLLLLCEQTLPLTHTFVLLLLPCWTLIIAFFPLTLLA